MSAPPPPPRRAAAAAEGETVTDALEGDTPKEKPVVPPRRAAGAGGAGAGAGAGASTAADSAVEEDSSGYKVGICQWHLKRGCHDLARGCGVAGSLTE